MDQPKYVSVKISDIIEILQKLKDVNGDIEIYNINVSRFTNNADIRINSDCANKIAFTHFVI